MVLLPAREVLQATPRTRLLHLELQGEPFVFTAGQAVLAGLAGSALRRPYSIACSPGQATSMDALELLVQIEETGMPDPHLERVLPGTPVAIEGPFGSFGLPPLVPNGELLFIAGGTGIAPLRSMLWDAMERGGAARLALVYSARSADEFAYREELEGLAREGRLDLRMTVTREHPHEWAGARGRVDETLIRSVLRTSNTSCVVCGPPGMVASATSLLSAAGVSESRIVTETFVG